jgi:glutaredoxin
MFCGKVKEFLSQNKMEYVDRNVAADEGALAELEKLGYMTTPITVIDGQVVTVSTGQKVVVALSWLHLRRCFPRTGFLNTPYALNSDYSLYNQAPTTLATMISTKPTMLPMTNRRFGNNPNGICPRVGSAYPTTQ